MLRAELDGMRYTLLQQRVPNRQRAISLSAREREIARLISGGHTNRTVAAVLDISLWTVDTHIRRIFTKLGVRSRSAMVAKLAELGLLDKPHTPGQERGRPNAG
jgi:DNA-binding CsgD family transcriptional regulator